MTRGSELFEIKMNVFLPSRDDEASQTWRQSARGAGKILISVQFWVLQMLFMVMVTHVHHVGVNFASLGLICGSGCELPYSLHHSPERHGWIFSRMPMGRGDIMISFLGRIQQNKHLMGTKRPKKPCFGKFFLNCLSCCQQNMNFQPWVRISWKNIHPCPERLWSGSTVSRSPDDGSMMLRLKNLSFTECDCYLWAAPGPSFVLWSLSQHLEFHQIQK